MVSQLDHDPAQRRWIVHRELAAADRSLAVLICEVKGPAFVALEVEQQPAHRERVPRMPVDALALNPREIQDDYFEIVSITKPCEPLQTQSPPLIVTRSPAKGTTPPQPQRQQANPPSSKPGFEPARADRQPNSNFIGPL
jgi:hypothetical protein